MLENLSFNASSLHRFAFGLAFVVLALTNTATTASGQTLDENDIVATLISGSDCVLGTSCANVALIEPEQCVPSCPPGDGPFPIYQGPPLISPTDVAVAKNGDILVVDRDVGDVFRITPGGGPVPVNMGGLSVPKGIAIEERVENCPGCPSVVTEFILVTEAIAEGQGVYRIDPFTGAVEPVATNGTTEVFLDPRGLAVQDNGKIVVADIDVTGQFGVIHVVDPNMGLVQTLAQANGLQRPNGIAIEHDGHILVADSGNGFDPGKVLRIDPEDGSVSEIAADGQWVTPVDIAIEEEGDILVTDLGREYELPYDPGFPVGPGGVFRINIETNVVTLVASGPPPGHGVLQAIAVAEILPVVPVAHAGPDQLVNEGSVVTLDGSRSTGAGEPYMLEWTQVGGPAVDLDVTDQLHPTFEAPAVSGPETLTFSVVVTDGTFESDDDLVNINVRNSNDPPTCDLAIASVPMLWSPNHQMRLVEINNVMDPNDQFTLEITSVTQDEPVDGISDGDTAPDAEIITDSGVDQVRLRSERSASGNGRVYMVDFTADDGFESCDGWVTVIVPESSSSEQAIDDGQLFDSTLSQD